MVIRNREDVCNNLTFRGSGLVGLVVHHLGAARVVVTDQEEIIDLLSLNIEQNADKMLRKTITAHIFNWGTPSFRKLLHRDEPFDYIVISDCM
jgi:hypothetical protein